MEEERKDTTAEEKKNSATAQKPEEKKNSGSNKKRKHGKGGKKDNPGSGTSGKPGYRGYDSIRSNDIAWYNKNPILYNAATNIPARTVIGLKEDHPYSVTSHSGLYGPGEGQVYWKYNQPSVMAIQFIPGFGVSDTYTSPANKCFQNIYSTMYSKTTGASLSFPQWELGIFTIAVQSIAMLIAYSKRALSTLYYRPANNLAIPQILLEAMGCDFDDLSANANDYTARLNEIIQNFNTLKVPAFIDVFKRHYSLCNNIYMDEDNVFAQYYVFVPECWYLFSDLGALEGGEYNGIAGAYAFTMPQFGRGAQPLKAIFDIIDKQIDAIRSSSDAANILGGLMRAFGDSELMELQPFEFMTLIEPTRDQIILEQINNCTPVGIRQTSSLWTVDISDEWTCNSLVNVSVTADPIRNTILSHYGYARHSEVFSAHEGANLINFFTRYENDEYREHIMEATRLVPIPYTETELSSSGELEVDRVGIASAGTEVVTRFMLFTPSTMIDGSFAAHSYSFFGAFLVDSIGNTFEDGVGSIDATHFLLAFENIMDLTKFKYHPRLYVEGAMTTGDDVAVTYLPAGKFIGDINYYTYIAQHDLEQLHNVAMLSVFDVTGKMPEGKPVR